MGLRAAGPLSGSGPAPMPALRWSPAGCPGGDSKGAKEKGGIGRGGGDIPNCTGPETLGYHCVLGYCSNHTEVPRLCLSRDLPGLPPPVPRFGLGAAPWCRRVLLAGRVGEPVRIARALPSPGTFGTDNQGTRVLERLRSDWGKGLPSPPRSCLTRPALRPE